MKQMDYFEIDEDKDNKSGCAKFCHQCDPRHDPIEFINTLSLGFLILGLVIVTITFAIPREYDFNPQLPATKMEAITIYYANRGRILDACIVIGTILVAIGALLLGGIFTYMLLRGDFKPLYDDEEEERRIKANTHCGYGTEPSAPPHGGGVNDEAFKMASDRNNLVCGDK